MVLIDGILYAAGANDNGQQGHSGMNEQYNTFTDVTSRSSFITTDVQQVSTGSVHTMIMMDDKVYTFGQFDDRGQGQRIGRVPQEEYMSDD